MKTFARSQSGFIQLTLIFACVILLLFALGAQGIYTAIKNRKPIAVSCEQYSRTKPKAAWLALTNCVLDLRGACYSTLIYKNVEVPTELFIPVRSTAQKEPAKDNVLLATRDPELMKTVREIESLSSKEEFEEWLARNSERVFVQRDVQGLVQFGVELDKGQRHKIARLQDNLTPDFIILEEGKRPEVRQSVGYLALGAVMVVVSVVFVRRSREPAPSETY